MYLLDTNVMIYALQGIQPWAGFLEEAIKEKKLVFSPIVVAEFLIGANDEATVRFRRLLEKFEVLPIDRVVAEVAATYRKKYALKTKKVWLSDCLVAAACKVYGVTLVTVDKKDYPMEDIEIKSKI